MSTQVKKFIDYMVNVDNRNFDNVFELFKDEEKREIIYRYFKNEESMEEFYDYLEDTDERIGEEVLKNICHFYPLSRSLIEFLVDKNFRVNKQSSVTFLLSKKFQDSFFNVLVENINKLDDILDNNSALNSFKEELYKIEDEINQKSKMIEEFQRENETLKEKTLENKDLQVKREELEVINKKLKMDMQKENIEKDIKKLEDQIQEKKDSISKKKKEKDELKKQLTNLDIDKLEEEEKTYINKLIKLWPDDESNG